MHDDLFYQLQTITQQNINRFIIPSPTFHLWNHASNTLIVETPRPSSSQSRRDKPSSGAPVSHPISDQPSFRGSAKTPETN